MVSEAKKRVNSDWDKANTKRYNLKVMKNTESDIIEKLDQQDNVNGYIKRLIREDIQKGQKQPFFIAYNTFIIQT